MKYTKAGLLYYYCSSTTSSSALLVLTNNNTKVWCSSSYNIIASALFGFVFTITSNTVSPFTITKHSSYSTYHSLRNYQLTTTSGIRQHTTTGSYTSIINSPFSMTRTVPTTKSRQSIRLLQSKSGDVNNNTDIDATPLQSPKKKVKTPITKKKTVTDIKIETVSSSTLSNAAETDHDTYSNDKPWYTLFTNGDIEYDRYMAEEWGYEQPYNDQRLFEKLSLEGAQAGLTWRTILHKRDAYRTTFFNFDPNIVATMTENDIERIINEQPIDPKNTRTVIVRHRGKIESVIHNAKCILKMRQDFTNNSLPNNSYDSTTTTTTVQTNIDTVFAHYLWSFVDHKPILYINRNKGNYASTSIESIAMSNALKKQYDFKFVGPTTCYSLMQAVGMVIDHPYNTTEWQMAYERLQKRPGGYQERIL